MAGDDLDHVPAADPGDDFEQMCWGLLRRRYKPHELQHIPADMGGDCGIEGFSTDGTVYQCYADRDSQSLRHRTDKQKEKLTTDTLKLQQKADKLKAMLGDMTVEHYIFMVPEFHAAELIQHATKRSAVVRDFKLEFIDTHFAIRVKTPKDYPAEYNAAVRDGGAKAVVPEPEVKSEEIELFSEETPDLVKVLETKLSVLHEASPGANVTILRDQFIRAFLAKEQVMAALREWPDTWEAVEVRRKLRQGQLEIESELDPDAPDRRVLETINGYSEELLANVAGVRDEDARRIALGQAGEWLMRCPLRFRSPP